MSKTFSDTVKKLHLGSGPDPSTEVPYQATADLTPPNPVTMTGTEQNRYEVLTGERIQRAEPVETPAHTPAHAPAHAAHATHAAPKATTTKKK